MCYMYGTSIRSVLYELHVRNVYSFNRNCSCFFLDFCFFSARPHTFCKNLPTRNIEKIKCGLILVVLFQAEEVDDKAAEVFPADLLKLLDSKAWKERLEGYEKLTEVGVVLSRSVVFVCACVRVCVYVCVCVCSSGNDRSMKRW